MAQQKKKSTQGRRKRVTRQKQAEITPGTKNAREVSVDLGPIEPEVADILAIIDQAKGRPTVEREVESEDERGRGGAAARRGRGGRANERTPQQKDERGRRKVGKTKQL